MNRIKLIVAAVVALVLLAVSATPALASSDASSKKTEVVSQGDVVNGTYIKSADTVRISGTVNGDVLVAAGEVNIDGVVNGNVYAVGSSINISGKVSGNVHVAASQIIVTGSTGSLYALASSLLVTKDATISGGLMAAASKVEFAGRVSQATYIAASSVVFNGTSDSSLKAMTGYLEVGESAKIAGDLTYSDQTDVKIANDKNIEGSINKLPSSKPAEPGLAGKLVGVLYGLLTALVTGAVLLKLAPGTIGSTADFMSQKLSQSILTGIGFIILVPIVLAIMFFTIVGLPLAILGTMVYVATWMIGTIVPALWVGRKLLRGQSRGYGAEVLCLLVGLLALSVAGLIPVLGGLVSFSALVVGVGALVARNWQRIRHVGRLQHKA